MPAPYCQPEAEKIRVCGTVLGSVPEEGGVLTPGTGCGACLGRVFAALFCLASAVEEN